jgi:hypothetical protein
MAYHLLIAALAVSLSVPAFAAKRGSANDCRIVNFAPTYTKTTIRKGKRVYITRPIDRQEMAIICKPESAWRD